MRVLCRFTIFALVLGSAGVAQTAAASGNGPYAAPLTSAYADLSAAARKIVNDNSLSGAVVVLYDAQTFATLSAYPAAVEQLRSSMSKLCAATPGQFGSRLVPSLDFGGAASGLTALLGAVTPQYAIQGQSVTFDNTALLAAFVHAAGDNVIIPAYLMPAPQRGNVLTCEQESQWKASNSVADLWAGGAKAWSDTAKSVAAAPNDVAKKALQERVDSYQKVADLFIAPASDKGPAPLAKLLMVESLLRQIPDGKPAKVIDLKLDAAGIDSTTRTVLFWRSTKFSSTVMAHYTLMNLTKDGTAVELKPYKTDSVVILNRVKDAEKYVAGGAK